MSRRLKRGLIVLAALLVAGAAFVWALPEIVKWQAVKQIAALTGRQVSIEDIDINLFTGRVAIKGFRLAEPDPAQTFVGFERLDVRVVPWAIVRRTFRFAELRLTAPTVNVVRVSPTEFNFSDILKRVAAAPAPSPRPAEPDAKSRWVVALDQFALIRANISATDRAVTPVSEWKVRDLTIEAGNLSTAPSGPLGTLAVHGALNDSPMEFSARDIDLTPTSFAGKFSIQNFNLLQVRPYLPPLPVALESGIAGVDIAVKLELGEGPGGLATGLVTGDAAVTSLALGQPGKSTPFLTVPRIGVGLEEVNLVSRVVTLSAVDIEGLDLRAVRDKQEQIDLMDLTKKPPEGQPATPPARKGAPAPAATRSPAPGPAKSESADYKITIEKIGVKGIVTFTDESVSTPPTVLKVTDLALQVDDVTWPAIRPLNLALTMGLPGGGKFGAKGPVRIEPLDATLTVTTRDAPIEPYRAYFPFPASFSGKFNADSQNRVRLTNGKLTALSRGKTWATNLAVKGPDEKDASQRLERMEITGIDFGWPTHVRVAKVLLRKPSNEIDRAADGSLNVLKLFTPAPKAGASGSTGPAKARTSAAKPAASGPAEPDPLKTMDLSFKEIVIEDGYIRFLDHTTKPSFSNDISKLHLTVKDLSNKASQRAAVDLKAVVGGDSTLDISGQLSAIGAPTYVNLATELDKFALPSANPYVDGAIAWIIRRGDLTAKLDTTIEGEKLDAKNDILIGNLKVARSRPSDEVKKRLGLPLGLIVALIKDGDGNIHVKVPITGTLSDRQFDFSDAIWTAVRNVLVNVLKAPFQAVGGLFTRGDKIEELKVDPIVFAPGDGALSPEMERQAVRVADFLRRSPYIGLTLTSVTTPEDVEALKAREVTAKLDLFQKEKKIGDRSRAIRRYYEANFKDVPVPPTEDEQIAWLRQREPDPIGPLAELRRQRLEVTRDRLAKVEGIPETRLQTLAPDAPPAGAAPAAGSAPQSGAASTPGAPAPGNAPTTGAPTSGSAPTPGNPAPGAAPPSGAAQAPGGGSASGAASSPGAAAPAPGAAPAPRRPPVSETAPASGDAGAAPPSESASGTAAAAESEAKAPAGGGGRVEFGIVGESD
jgi:uncharacterized protein involved in outer membrane biogenesis